MSDDNEAIFTSLAEDIDKAIKALAGDVHRYDGWLSGAQDADLEYDDFNQSVDFCGEGAIDLHHLVSIVLGAVR